jgi:hypothetical protein
VRTPVIRNAASMRATRASVAAAQTSHRILLAPRHHIAPRIALGAHRAKPRHAPQTRTAQGAGVFRRRADRRWHACCDMETERDTNPMLITQPASPFLPRRLT